MSDTTAATTTDTSTASTTSGSVLSQVSSAATTATADTTAQTTAATTSAAQRPEWIPEKFWLADKGEPDVQKLGAAYVGLEKKLGTRVDIAPPDANSTPEQVAAWRKLNGVPEKPEDYGLKKPEQLPEGVQWNEKLAGDFAKLAHELHLPPSAVQKLAEFHNGNLGAMQKQAQETQAAKRAEVIGALKQEWGADFERTANDAATAAKAIGVDIETSELADHPDFIKAMANVAKLLKEDTRLPTESKSDLSASVTSRMEAIRNSADFLGKNGPEKAQAALAQLKRLHDSVKK
jgi:hypothetical protein